MKLSDLKINDTFRVRGDICVYRVTEQPNKFNTLSCIVIDGGEEGRRRSFFSHRHIIPIEFEIVKLERHLYAPELNSLHIRKDGVEYELSVPGQRTFDDAINYLEK